MGTGSTPARRSRYAPVVRTPVEAQERRSRDAFWFAVVCAVLAPLFLFSCSWMEYQLRDHGEVTQAQLTTITTGRTHRPRGAVTFTAADGRQVTTRLLLAGPPGKNAGHQVLVRYLPENPTVVEREGLGDVRLGVLVAAALTLWAYLLLLGRLRTRLQTPVAERRRLVRGRNYHGRHA